MFTISAEITHEHLTSLVIPLVEQGIDIPYCREHCTISFVIMAWMDEHCEFVTILFLKC